MALGYLLESKDAEGPDGVINRQIVEKVCRWLESGEKEMREAAVYFAGVICRSSPTLVDQFMDKNPLNAIKKILENETDEDLLLDAYYVVINLVGIPYRFLQAVVSSGVGAFIVNQIYIKQAPPKIMKKARECLKRIVKYGRYEDIEALPKIELLQSHVELLTSKNPEDLKYALKVMKYIMQKYGEEDELDNAIGDFDSVGGVDIVLDLINCSNPAISKMAKELRDEYLYVMLVEDELQAI
eukprot:TRINITY_DN2143_c0_g1_i3.p1 TRINITY_DN2143_c0_g1~~TRINITY_DN2143_c0_g1_i3.p1  ORF type:complete len:241 (+),score=85.37 TRINITY_DN2143_c0_g1_i3:248-970(+)